MSCSQPSVGPLDWNTSQRQKKEYIEWKRQEDKMAEPSTLCLSMIPLQYLGSGITVEPLESVLLIGLEVDSEFNNNNPLKLTVTSRYSLGFIYVESYIDTNILHISGNNSCQVRIQTDSVTNMNAVLKHVVYTSQEHHKRQRDYIDISFQDIYNVFMNVLIQRQHVPRLYDPGPGNDINNKVTIVAKTFERYDCVNALIASVNKFYPNMTIIIADDSENKQKLEGNNVKHYLMPFLEGYAAGKNLLVSQVRTKYLLWVDDDFVFTKDTLLERFVEKLESPTADLDLVAGYLVSRKEHPWAHVSYINDDDGGCISESDTSYGTLKEFPNCKLMDIVTNFFMAKTDAVRTVGFDSVFERISHREFFVDALGHLRIAVCDDVIIRHDRRSNERYRNYRMIQTQQRESARYAERVLFKNNLRCFQAWTQSFLEFEKYNTFELNSSV
ncbi:beta-1,4 N-acetylgalactosaminyltransferase 2-like [Saccoglossus kowalevskii]|uniref:Beta-1,4 N-acetylgalactosaminyltransferase 2-like n=1 Tax=Saccoglossus kowalevskii TaxID=10224 RepID=A0ABM0GM89_SACKO|nr:PREDICTED: beta-1,4 N-acetylgalactosaminyltransferase 2-like [Saccoglossus kowalevskii]